MKTGEGDAMSDTDRVLPFKLVHDAGHRLTPAQHEAVQGYIERLRSILDHDQRQLAADQITSHDDGFMHD